MPTHGYYRYPTIAGDTVVFVCEDDLWTVPAAGGVARRLTANPGQATRPALSPDGRLLAFSGRDEGNFEVYLMPAEGGSANRITYLGGDNQVSGWTPTGKIIFASNTASPFAREYALLTISPAGGEPEALPTGPALSVSFGRDGLVLGRHTTDLARWKRYRGGRTGELWVDPEGDGNWRKLISLPGNMALPQWVGDRVYFVSDHEGVGNLYSCTPLGDDLRRHTRHSAYYVRSPASDGQRIVYHAGADLYVFDLASDLSRKIEIEFYSPQPQRKRRFVPAEQFIQGYSLHPAGHSLALVARGKPFSFGNWEGPVVQHGDGGSTRHRLTAWLHDGKRLVSVSDAGGTYRLEIFNADGSPIISAASVADAEQAQLEATSATAQALAEEGSPTTAQDLGRPLALAPAPKRDQVAIINQRNELLLADLVTGTLRLLDRSSHAAIQGVDWSPDGNWLAYGFQNTQQTAIIKLCRVETGETFEATRPVLFDVDPAFDPEGKYLYFISYREFNPVYDNLHFDLNFPRGARPYLLTLRADLPSPFVPQPRGFGEPAKPEKKGDKPKNNDAKPDGEAKEEKEAPAEEPLQIDTAGIADRLLAFPVPEGRYRQVRGIPGKALFTVFPIEGALGNSWAPNEEQGPRGKLEVYDFGEQKHDTLIDGVSRFELSRDSKSLIYRAGRRLRVVKAGEKPQDNGGNAGRKSGWIDLGRVRVSVEPPAEWEQMYREAWRLQHEFFWTEDMSGVDWQAVYNRYLPLLTRVATRGEFSDLLWEMQGELGTSHAYEIGGDYRSEPRYSQGQLGADLRYDSESDSYVVEKIVRGDVWDEGASSPLARAGVNMRPGDRIVAIGGQRVGRGRSPRELLVNQAGLEVLLTVAPADGGAPRQVTVKTLRDETPARYREWVEANRAAVHRATEGQVGYLHIPDMGPRGYAEFHRGYLAEVGRAALIVDVRFNGGGHVSQLLLEKLARRRIGYDIQRYGEPEPYPAYSMLGPIVALTNEDAGSDGDIFSHAFKLLKLGPLIGKRTWGGVIGINPRDTLVDGGFTTQPGYSFWFEDVGWQVENYGTEPDLEVDISPQDYLTGRDTQLERAISVVQQLLAERPPRLPDFGARPHLALPVWEDG